MKSETSSAHLEAIPVMDSPPLLAQPDVLQEHEPDGEYGGEQRRGHLLHGVAYPRHLPGGALGRHGESASSGAPRIATAALFATREHQPVIGKG